MFAPVFERASERYPDTVFGKVDTEAQPELAAGFGISSIPTLMIIRDKVVLYAEPGALPQQALEQLITKLSRSTWTRSVPVSPPPPSRPGTNRRARGWPGRCMMSPDVVTGDRLA
jgi:hypothetical protein